MHPITLQARPGNWQKFVGRKTNPAFQAIKKKILARDQDTCQFCGFQANKYQEVVNLDHDYSHNTSKNLAAACCFCAQCFFIESLGMESYGGGTIIYLPEISQTDLNSLCHVLFCALVNGTDYKATAQTIYRSLKERSTVVEDTLGAGTSKPETLGRLLIEYQLEHQEEKKGLLKDLRLLPSHTKFKTQIEEWAEGALSELTEE